MPKLQLYLSYKKFNPEENKLETNYGYSDKKDISWKDYLLYEWNLLGVICTSLLCLVYIFLLVFGAGRHSSEVYFCIWAIGFLLCICPFCWMMRTLCSPSIIIDLDKIGILNLKHKHYREENKLIEKYFPTFIEDLEKHDLGEELKAELWREQHPLEEACRLAMTGNPNYVANLIRLYGEVDK